MEGAEVDRQALAVSIVIPAYGVADWVVGSVQSSLRQACALEVIVVDDASPDDGVQRVREAFPAEPRLRILSNHRAKGVCGARNTGLEVVRAPWVVFLDGDDELLPGGLDALSRGVGPGVVGVFGSFRHVDEAGDDVASSWLADRADALARFDERTLDLALLPRRTFNPPPGAILLETQALRAVGGWDEGESGVRQSEDFEVVMRVATRGTFAMVADDVLAYLQRSGSRSAGEGNDRSRLLTRLAIVRRAPRRWRPRVGRAQGQAYQRLVVPRLKAVGKGGGLRSAAVGGVDVLLWLGFIVVGLVSWVLPEWSPSWPPIGEDEQ